MFGRCIFSSTSQLGWWIKNLILNTDCKHLSKGSSVSQGLTCNVMGQTRMFSGMYYTWTSFIKQQNKIEVSYLGKIWQAIFGDR